MPTEVLAEGPFEVGHLRVRWVEVCAAEGEAAGRIEERWAEYVAEALARGKSLFNGKVAVLRGFRREGEGLELTLGWSDYKTFVVTCMRDRAWFTENLPGGIVEALGNSAVLSCGEWAYFGVRSQRVADYAGRAHVFGGVLSEVKGKGERGEGKGGGGANEDIGSTDGRASGDTGSTFLLGHLWEELGEEVGVGREDAAGLPRLLGLFRDRRTGQPELVWQVELKRGVEKVDAGEHDGVVKVRFGEKVDGELFTPMGVAGAVRWKRWMTEWR